LEEIVKIEPLADLTVRIVWSDGRDAHVDFAPMIDKSPVFDPMRDPGFFIRNAQITHTGSAIAWSDVLEFSSDGLRYDAFPEEYRRDFGDAAAEWRRSRAASHRRRGCKLSGRALLTRDHADRVRPRRSA